MNINKNKLIYCMRRCKNCKASMKNTEGLICPVCDFINEDAEIDQIRRWIANVNPPKNYSLKGTKDKSATSGYERHATMDPNVHRKAVQKINDSFELEQVWETKRFIRWQITSLDDKTLELTEIDVYEGGKETKLNKNVRRIMKRKIFAQLIKNGFYQISIPVRKSDVTFMVSSGFYELLKG